MPEFRIQRCLGRGGFGEVYRGVMSRGGGVEVEVAIKVLRPDLEPESQGVQRLRDEGRLLGRLTHPTILRVYDLVVIQGRAALVSEYVAGEDLGRLLREDRIPPRAVFEVVAQVAAALDAAWSWPSVTDGKALHLVHRDVKPDNIRIDPHGVVKLLDFGIAQAQTVWREAQTSVNTIMGSTHYLAPERLVQQEVGPEADVFALGCTLFEALTGEALFARKSMRQMYVLMVDEQRFEDFVGERCVARADRLGGERSTEMIRAMTAWNKHRRPTGAEVASRCDTISDTMDGSTLTQWCRGRVWPEARGMEGPLDGYSFVTSVPGTANTGSGSGAGSGASAAASPSVLPAAVEMPVAESAPPGENRGVAEDGDVAETEPVAEDVAETPPFAGEPAEAERRLVAESAPPGESRDGAENEGVAERPRAGNEASGGAPVGARPDADAVTRRHPVTAPPVPPESEPEPEPTAALPSRPSVLGESGGTTVGGHEGPLPWSAAEMVAVLASAPEVVLRIPQLGRQEPEVTPVRLVDEITEVEIPVATDVPVVPLAPVARPAEEDAETEVNDDAEMAQTRVAARLMEAPPVPDLPQFRFEGPPPVMGDGEEFPTVRMVRLTPASTAPREASPSPPPQRADAGATSVERPRPPLPSPRTVAEPPARGPLRWPGRSVTMLAGASGAAGLVVGVVGLLVIVVVAWITRG